MATKAVGIKTMLDADAKVHPETYVLPADRNGWTPTFVLPNAVPKLKMLISGSPGVGKTTLGGSATLCPDMCPVIFASLEGGTLSISEPLDGFVDPSPDKLRIVEIGGLGELDRLMEWLETTSHGFKTIVFDSASDMQENLIELWQAQMTPKDKEGLPDNAQIEKAQQRMYSRVTDGMRERIRRLRDLDMHVLLLCGEADNFENPKASANQRYPALMPKLRKSVVGYVDVSARLYIRPGEAGGVESERLLLCTPTATDVCCKDRSPGGKLGKVIVDPTMSKIMALLAGKG